MVLPGCDLTSALIRADQVLSLVSTTPIGVSNRSRKITLSLGVAVADRGHSLELNELVHRADCALYKAKSSGRNQVRSMDFAETVLEG
jgi:diguanylate cyclase (GGDEF)-like protein